jgi:hypothetical protein
MLRRSVKLCLLTALAALTAVFAPAQQVLNRHQVVLDAQGKLLSWSQPQEQAYDRVMRLACDFLLNTVPVEANGLKTLYTHCCIDQHKLRGDDWLHNPAGLYAMLVDSATEYYPYSGDHRVLDLARGLLDYQLAHGTTPVNWEWGGVPYASSDPGATEYRGAHDFLYVRRGSDWGRGDGYGAIEPDKLGELGIGYLRFHELTGEAVYREAALACANALARHVRPGDDLHSPWPFRVFAEDNTAREEYSANVIGPIRLFDELVRLNLGDVPAYRRARHMAWTWMMDFPMKNHAWNGYFEDVPVFEKPTNFNQYSPMETARYILQHPEYDPRWKADVPALINWVEETFGVDVPGEPGHQWGAQTISEQIHDMHKMGSHTSRYASVNALWYEITGDVAAKEKAFRSFNWATYMCHENGAVNDLAVEGQTIWFSDGYGDYIRHFMAGLGSVPEWAPPRENHLLRSSSIVQSVLYLPEEVNYKTFDATASQILRLDFTPRRVVADGQELPKRADRGEVGWTFDPQHGVLQVRYQNSHVIHVLGH